MNTTYMNSRADDVYPFVPGTALPFSHGCINDIRICYHAASTVSLDNVKATAVGISEDRVTVTLCYGSSTTFLCTVSGSVGGECDVCRADVGGIKLSAFLSAGRVLPSDIGSYAVSLPLEGSCVTRMPGDVYTQTEWITVNGTANVPDECLRINSTGYLQSTIVSTSTGATMSLTASVPDDAEMSPDVSQQEYEKVAFVNGRSINMMSGSRYTGYLVIQLQCPSLTQKQAGSYEQKAGKASTFFSYTVSGDMRCPDFPAGTEETLFIYTSSEGSFAVTVPGNVPSGTTITNPYDEDGASVIVTITGNRQIPSCYVRSEDDAPDGLA